MSELLSDVHDSYDRYDRLGMIYEARGDNKQAADYYRRAIAFIRISTMTRNSRPSSTGLSPSSTPQPPWSDPSI